MEKIIKMSKAKIVLCVLGIAAGLSGAMIPLSSTNAKGAIERNEVSISLGIAKYLGIDSISNTSFLKHG